jgi:aldose 1-epimerase
MPYQVSETTDAATGLFKYVLDGPSGSHVEIAPTLGCNCIEWQVGGRDVLWAPPLAELAERPTRGGIPILFPFPNRIRGGRFTWSGREYQLPCNDSTKANAIHGFSPRVPWRVMECSAERDGAHLAADFIGSRDAKVDGNLWPADPRLSMRFELQDRSLRLEATVRNSSDVPLPFGLGYHPYFAISPGDRIGSPSRGRWELQDSLPAGKILPLDTIFDLRDPRRVAELTLDDVYTDFPAVTGASSELIERGRVLYADGGSLSVRTSRDFRELVVFTPPHRKAVCLEPYTCPTDAVNLAARGLDVGWQTLAPDQTWSAVVEFRIET